MSMEQEQQQHTTRRRLANNNNTDREKQTTPQHNGSSSSSSSSRSRSRSQQNGEATATTATTTAQFSSFLFGRQPVSIKSPASAPESTTTTTTLTRRPPLHHHQGTTPTTRTAAAAATSATSTESSPSPWRRTSRFFQRQRKSSSAGLPLRDDDSSTHSNTSSTTSSTGSNIGSGSNDGVAAAAAAAITSTNVGCGPATTTTTDAAAAAASLPAPSLSFPLEYPLYEMENIDDAMFSLYSIRTTHGGSLTSSSSSSSSSFLALPPPPLDSSSFYQDDCHYHQNSHDTSSSSSTRCSTVGKHSRSFSSSSYIVKQEFDPILDARLGDYDDDDDDHHHHHHHVDDENEYSENDEASKSGGGGGSVAERYSRQLLLALHADPLQSGWETLFVEAAAAFDDWFLQNDPSNGLLLEDGCNIATAAATSCQQNDDDDNKRLAVTENEAAAAAAAEVAPHDSGQAQDEEEEEETVEEPKHHLNHHPLDSSSDNTTGSNPKNNHDEANNHHHHHHEDESNSNNNNNDDSNYCFQFGEFDDSSTSQQKSSPRTIAARAAATPTTATTIDTATADAATTTTTTTTSASIPDTAPTRTAANVNSNSNNNNNNTDTGDDDEEDNDDDDFGEFQSACSWSPPPPRDLVHVVHDDDDDEASAAAKQSLPLQLSPLQHQEEEKEAKRTQSRPSLLLQPTIVQLPPLPILQRVKQDEDPQELLECWRQTLPTSIFNHYSSTTLVEKQQQQQQQQHRIKPKQELVAQQDQVQSAATSTSSDTVPWSNATDFPETAAESTTTATITATVVLTESSTTTTILDATAAAAPISLTLPITDLTTLEARFTRRRQLEYERRQQQQQRDENGPLDTSEREEDDDQELNERLDQLLPNFYTTNGSSSKNTDHVEMSQFLRTLPWGYLQEQLDGEDDDDGDGGSHSSSNNSLDNAATEQSAGLILWNEHMTDQLSQMDGLLQRVQQSLLQRVCRRSSTSTSTAICCSTKLQQANDLIHEFETNLRLAFMYWERADTSLQLAARTATCSSSIKIDDSVNTNDDNDNDGNSVVDGLLGPQVLLNLWQQREEYQRLQRVLNQLHAVLEQEGEIIRRIDAFDARHASALEEYRSVMELAQRITLVAHNDSDPNTSDAGILSKLTCLDELRTRRSSLGDRFRKRLHQLAKSLVVRSCRGHAVDWMQYERLVRSTLDLHSLHNQEQHYQPDEDEDDDVALNQYHCDDDKKDDDDVMVLHNFDASCLRMATMWSETIMQALSYEADCCLATALLTPTDRVASDFERELGQLSQEIQLDWGDAAKLRTMTHNLVTIRFDFEASKVNYLPRVFHCLCQDLTAVLHAHFLFLQWHRAPFDCEQSRTIAQLHQMRKEEQQQNQDPAMDANGASAKSQDTIRLRYIRDGLEASRLNLWNRCENVIVKCLEEYLNFAAKRKLFQRAGGEDDDNNTANKIDDSLWAQQLQGYHEVLAMADRFFAIKAAFLDDQSLIGQGSNISPIHQKLKAVFRQHLRTVHVEAMNSLGRQLSTETWVLRSLDTLRSFEPTDGSFTNVEHLLRDAIRATSENKQALLSKTSKWCPPSNTNKHGALNCFYEFLENGNPFQTRKDSAAQSSSQTAITKVIVVAQQHAISDFRPTVYSAIQTVLQEDNDNSMPRCAPDSIASGLVPWVSRLLTILDKLPVITDDAVCVFANLFDLYVATVFRLCTGSSQNEKALSMVEEPSPNGTSTTSRDPHSPSFVNKKRPSSPTIFGSLGKERRPSSGSSAAQRAPVAIPSSLEVEMCRPRIKDSAKLVPLRQFIDRAHASLQGIVNLDRANCWIRESSSAVDADEYACDAARILEKREAAAWSCHLVAALADVALSLAKASTPALFTESLQPLESYVLSAMQAVPILVRIVSQYSCVKAISGLDVTKRIVTVGKGWEEHTLHEYPNDYVEDLGDRCALIWGFLAASGKLPSEIRKQAWGRLLCGCYLSLLEGFSRVPYCSTEGRALMTLDLASFSAMMDTTTVAETLESRGLSFRPPSAAPEYGMRYVDTYIKVSYYPKEDVMQWIEQNYESYRLIHVLALLNGDDNATLVETVMPLYHQQEAANRDLHH